MLLIPAHRYAVRPSRASLCSWATSLLLVLLLRHLSGPTSHRTPLNPLVPVIRRLASGWSVLGQGKAVGRTHHKYVKVMDFDNNDNGETPLYVASRNGDVDLVRLLIDVEALINQADEDGETPLWMASQNGHLAIVRYLILHGSGMEQPDNQGRTPLAIAIAMGHADVAEYLASNECKAEVKWQRRKFYAFFLNSMKDATEIPGPAFEKVVSSTQDLRQHIASFL